MILFISILAALVLVILAYLQHPKFGAAPKGSRLKRMQASPHYRNGAFHNLEFTPSLTEGFSLRGILFAFLFKRGPRTIPGGEILSLKTDLQALPAGDWLVWMGHSSYYLQLHGLKILVDPVFSGNASPLPGSTKAFRGADIYRADELPPLDYLIITHDHYDHLDYETVTALQGKVRKVICGLGVGAHLERWGYAAGDIIEMEWNTETALQPGVRIYGLTARHFSGRTFRRNSTLWMSFLLETPTKKIYIGGDSGFGDHFTEIGAQHGPIDLAILENGQYNEAWKAIHFLPGENLQAAVELKAKRLMPVHSGKFRLAFHDWDQPLKEMWRLNKETGLPLVTPRIGEPVDLNDEGQVFGAWWNAVERQV